MTPEYVREKVKFIESVADDDERAHLYEDALYCEILYAIAEERCENPKECAKEALKTDDLNFSRWCA